MNGEYITNLVSNWLNIERYTKVEISDKLGISRPTLDSRIKIGNWKKLEKSAILNMR